MNRRNFLKASAGIAAAPVVARSANNANIAGSFLPWAAPTPSEMGVAATMQAAGTAVAPVPGTAMWLWQRLGETERAREIWKRVWRTYRKGLRKRHCNPKPCAVVWEEHLRTQARWRASRARGPVLSRAYKKHIAIMRAKFPGEGWWA